jgi:hypothetical protein
LTYSKAPKFSISLQLSTFDNPNSFQRAYRQAKLVVIFAQTVFLKQL